MPIPEIPPWRPSILQTGYPPPDSGELWAAGVAAGKQLEVRHYQYWRRLHACSAECGGTDEQTSEETIGWSAQVVRELSDTLKLGTKQLAIELGEKTSESLTRIDERKEIVKTTVAAPKCGVVKTAKWQLVERFVLIRHRRTLPFFTKVAEELDRADRRLGVTSQEVPILIDPVERCCREPSDFPGKGRETAYVIAFPSGCIVLPGRVVSGLVRLRGVAGEFRVGATISRHDLAPGHVEFLDSVSAAPSERGTLDWYPGSVARLLGLPRQPEPVVSSSRWAAGAAIGLGIGVALIALYRGAERGRIADMGGSQGGREDVAGLESDGWSIAARDVRYPVRRIEGSIERHIETRDG
jgi:hypothetical protein